MRVYSRSITATAFRFFSLFLGAPAILMGTLACSGGAFSAAESPTDGPDAPDIASSNDDASSALDTGGVSHDASAVLPGIDASLLKDTGHPSDVNLPSRALELWLSADVGVTLVNQKVTRWQDRSGLGNDATQPDPAAQPTLTASWRGGNPAITFDAVSGVLLLPSGFANFSIGLSLFVVADVTSDQVCPSLIEFSNGGEVNDVTLQDDSGAISYEVDDHVLATATDQVPLDKPLLLEVIHSSAGLATVLSNGAVVAAITSPLPPTVARLKNEIGRSSYVNCTLLGGHLAEVVLYNRGLDTNERLSVEDYLRRKWKI